MARRSLKPQLNQIRAWVQQGRTDAWIAHQLEVSASELRDFRRQHGLDPDGEEGGTDEVDLRDEIEAEIEAATVAEDAEEDQGEGAEEPDGSEAEGRPRRRRRRGRRGGRGRRSRRSLEATFDHGDEGFGLWLDPAVQDDANYAEHWAGHREVTVTIEPEQIVIRRVGGGPQDEE